MERLREARRGSAVGLNGGGIAKRRPRSDEEGALEMPESTASRLRDRASKRDRDRERERLSQGKRRRESVVMHDGDESSEESLGDEDEEEDEDEMSVPARVHNPSTSNASPANHHHHHNNNNHHLNHGSGNSNSNQNHGSNQHQQQHQQQQRKNFLRAPAKWRADEMIGVPVPRKARTSSAKRTSNEWLESAQRQASASPSRMSPASTSQQISPSSSNASLRKKMKPMAGSKQPRPPPPKVSSNSNSNLSSKPSYFIQEEIEVAEVLFGLTRQFKQEHSQKHEWKDQTETKSVAGAPQQSFPVAHEPIIAPKRKRPRSLKEEEAQVSLPSTSKLDIKSGSEIKAKFESSSPKREKNADKNGFQSVQNTTELDRRAESEKKANNNSSVQEFKPETDRLMNRMETKEQNFLPVKESPKIDRREESSTKIDLLSDGTREPKFSIDLMAPPERDDFNDSDHKAQLMCPPDSHMGVNNGKRKEDEKLVRLDLDTKKVDNSKKMMINKERMSLDLQLDLEKPGNEIMVPTRATDKENQQLKSGKVESRQDNKTVPQSSVPMPMVGGWPGNLPPFGFMSQVPTLPAGLVPMPSNPNSSSNLPARVPMLPSPIPRPKRCGTHCYIAQLISYHQRLAKINPFWPPTPASTPPVYGAPHPFGLIPPVSDARGLDVKPAAPAFNAAEKKVGPQSTNNVINNSSGNVNSNNGGGNSNSNLVAEQRKQQQMAIQQQVQTGPMGNMMPGPAFFFPVNQQQVAAMAAANRNPPAGGPTPSAASSAPTGVTPPMNMSFAGLPPGADPAQFLAILQNGAYPYPVPAGANAGGQTAYRGPPGQPMPFFNAPFYPPQMMQAAHLPPHQQAGSVQTQNQQPIKTGVSSSLSSAQKNQQQQIHIQDLSSFNDKPTQDNNNNNRVMNQSQKGVYGHNFSLPMHPQNFAFMSPASSASQSQPQSQSQLPDPKPVDHPTQPSRNSSGQNQRIDLAQSQPFAMPFGSFNGPNVGLDFSSMVQPHPMFQNHEVTRHGYFPAPGPPAGAPSKSASGDSTSTNDRKSNNNNNNLGSGSLSFSKRESNNEQNQNPSSVLSNTSGGDNGNNNSSSRTLNLIPAYRDGHNSGSSRTGNSNPALSTTSSSTIPPNMSGIQQQSIMHQMQKQVQQQQQQVQQQVHQQLQQQMSQQQMMAQHFASRPNNNNINNNNSNNNNRSNNMSGFPSLMNFPHSQIQSGTGNNSPSHSHSHSQSPQWKQNPSSRSGTPIPGSSQNQNPGCSQIQKSSSHLHPTQNRTLPFSPHQTQISFGGGSNTALKTVQSQPGGPQEINRSLAAAAMANQQKSGSPGPVSGSKPGSAGNNSPMQQQQVGKNGSGSKPGPAPSILGQPNLGQAQSQSQHQMKSQSQHQMKQQQQQQMSQHQLYFSSYAQQPQGNISMKPHKSPAQQQNTGNNNNNVNSNNSQGGPTLVRMPTHGMMTNQGGTGGGQRVAGSFPYNMPAPPVSMSGKNVSEQKPNAAGGN